LIITKCPLRISIVGGGTDLPLFCNEYSGNTTTIAINKFIYIALHNYFDEKVSRIRYSKLEEVNQISDVNHNIFREVLMKYRLKNIEVSSIADIRSGSGLGSSSSFTNALIAACHVNKGAEINRSLIAQESSEIEIERLNYDIGRQDHYSTAFGGFQNLEFNGTSVERKALQNLKIQQLFDKIILINTGPRSTSVYERKQVIFKKLNDEKIQILIELANLSREYYKCIQRLDFDSTYEVLQLGWDLKKKTHDILLNPSVSSVISHLNELGAKSFKLLGSGGGGFIMVYEKNSKIYQQINRDFDKHILRVSYASEGIQLIEKSG
jgi:D-glycero-alpha-D-manno-heptose-7-phosphate kinase